MTATPWGKTDITEQEYSRNNRIDRADVYVKSAMASARTYPFVNSSNQTGDEVFGLLMAATHIAGIVSGQDGGGRRVMMHEFLDAICDTLDRADALREHEDV